MLNFRRILLLVVISQACFACTASEFKYLPDVQVVEVKPQMIAEPVNSILFTVKTDLIEDLLNNILLFDDMDQYESLPYIVGFDRDTNIASRGDKAYVMGLDPNSGVTTYSLLKPGKVFTHPDTESVIGLEVNVVGTAEILSFGNPQIVRLSDTKIVMEPGTRLIPQVGLDLPAYINAQYPTDKMRGYILALGKDFFGGGDYSLVVINLGVKHGLKPGSVLDLMEGKRTLVDFTNDEEIDIPSEKFGQVLIYKAADKISLGIITEAKRMVIEGDIVAVTSIDNSGQETNN